MIPVDFGLGLPDLTDNASLIDNLDNDISSGWDYTPSNPFDFGNLFDTNIGGITMDSPASPATTDFWGSLWSNVSSGVGKTLGSSTDSIAQYLGFTPGGNSNTTASGTQTQSADFFNGFLSGFLTTKTGQTAADTAQNQAAAAGVNAFINSPWVWLGIGGLILFLILRR